MDYEERERLKKREARKKKLRRKRMRQRIITAVSAVIAVALVGTLLYFVLIKPNQQEKTTQPSAETDPVITLPDISTTEEASGEAPASVSESESVQPSQEQPSSVPSSEDTAPADREAQTVIPQTPDPNNGVLVDSHQFDLSGLSNKSIGFGCADEYDELGRATGLYYYEHLYGKYGQYYYVHTNDKVVYLTMDEGYEAGFTEQILDTLKEKNVKAVFFITNQFLTEVPQYVQRMIDEGHIIGNHTCRHPAGGYPKYVDAHGLESFTEDLARLHKAVYDRFGYTMKLFRFPEGESSELTLAQTANLGYSSVFWSFTQYDFNPEKQPDPAKTLAEDVERAAPGVIYLLHACSATNTQILGDFIDQVRARGYEFGVFPGY